MNKSILISIQPKWCELIASGKKTIEVRKTRPKLDTPFKVYIYCTKGEYLWKDKERVLLDGKYNRIIDNMPEHLLNGKVIGEFVCDKIYCIGYDYYHPVGYNVSLGEISRKELYEKSCLDFRDIDDYLNMELGYGWHISNLVIYDKPKELREFHNFCETYPCCDESCEYYSWTVEGGTECMCDTEKPFKRPPQSWRYVEELDNGS